MAKCNGVTTKSLDIGVLIRNVIQGVNPGFTHSREVNIRVFIYNVFSAYVQNVWHTHDATVERIKADATRTEELG